MAQKVECGRGRLGSTDLSLALHAQRMVVMSDTPPTLTSTYTYYSPDLFVSALAWLVRNALQKPLYRYNSGCRRTIPCVVVFRHYQTILIASIRVWVVSEGLLAYRNHVVDNLPFVSCVSVGRSEHASAIWKGRGLSDGKAWFL